MGAFTNYVYKIWLFLTTYPPLGHPGVPGDPPEYRGFAHFQIVAMIYWHQCSMLIGHRRSDVIFHM